MRTKKCAAYHIDPPLGSQNQCLLCRRAKYDKAAQQAYHARPEIKARINALRRSKYVPHPRPPLTEAEQQQRAERQERARQRKRLVDKLRHQLQYRARPKSIFCKRGHVVVTRTKGGHCRDCRKITKTAARQLKQILGLWKRPKQSTEAKRAQKARARLRQKQADPEGYAKKIAEKRARQHARNPAARRERRQRWKRNNPEQRAVQRRQHKLKRRGVPGKHTVAELRARYAEQEGRCFWCREALSDDYHRDHVIPVSKGGTNDIRNIVLACAPCNVRKSDTHPLELLLA